MKMTEFELNESLFMEAEEDDKYTVNQVADDTFDEIFAGTDVDKVSEQTLQMIKNPYKKFAQDPYTGQNKAHVMQKEAFILLRLYELTIWNPNNPYVHKGTPYTDPFTGEVFDPAYGVHRRDLLKMLGVANPDEPGEGSTYFGDYKHIGLAYLNPADVKSDKDYLFPGSRLEPYIRGCLDSSYGAETFNRTTKQMEPFTNDASDPNPKTRGASMADDIGKLPDRPRVTPSASKTRNPGKMDNPFADILPSSEIIPEEPKPKEETPQDWFKKDEKPAAKPVELVEPEVKPVDVPKTFKKFNTSKFKRRTEDLDEGLELTGDAYLMQEDIDFVNEVKKAYRNWRGLADDADLTDEYSDDDFRAVCCCNNWPTSTREKIWKGRKFA